MKLNEKQIAALEEKGFKRWTKGSLDRLYINAETLGLEVDRYKSSGYVSSAYYRGERLSHKRGSEMASAKTYIDIATGELTSGNWTLEQDARQLYEETMEALEATEAEANGEQAIGDKYSQMDDTALMIAESNAKGILAHRNSTTYSQSTNVTIEQREEALEILRDIRHEQWSRGWNATPTAENLEDYKRYLLRWEEKLKAAIADGNMAKIYVAKNHINDITDSINYVNRV